MSSKRVSATLLLTCIWTLLALCTGRAHAGCPDPVSASCPHGFYMAELSTGATPQIAGRPFVVTASGGTGSTPANLTVSQVSVDGTTIRVETWIDLGPWAMPGSWSEPFLIPALEPGSYTLELLIWDASAQEMILNSTSSVEVRAVGVPTLSRMGLPALVVLLTVAGALVIRRMRA